MQSDIKETILLGLAAWYDSRCSVPGGGGRFTPVASFGWRGCGSSARRDEVPVLAAHRRFIHTEGGRLHVVRSPRQKIRGRIMNQTDETANHTEGVEK